MDRTERNQAGDSWREAYDRICSVLGVSTQMQVAAALGIKQSSVSDAKRRGSIPADWQLILLEEYGVLPAWVRTGIGPMHVGEAGACAPRLGNAQMAQVQALFRDFT